jgi:hypothetical protein
MQYAIIQACILMVPLVIACSCRVFTCCTAKYELNSEDEEDNDLNQPETAELDDMNFKSI